MSKGSKNHLKTIQELRSIASQKITKKRWKNPQKRENQMIQWDGDTWDDFNKIFFTWNRSWN